MKKFTYVKIVALILLAFTFVAQAQNKKLIFSNGQETDIQGNATININTGDITVQPVSNNKLIVDAPTSEEAIIGFYPNKYAINQGDSIAVNWAVAYTYPGSNCTASVTQGSATWTGNKNAAPGVYVQPIVTVSQLPATLRLTCDNYNSGSTYQEFSLEQKENQGTIQDPVINAFQLTSYPGANPTIPNNGTYNIQWNVSNLTGSCTATSTGLSHGGWTGTITTAIGNRNIDIVDEPILRLICSNGGNQVQRSITITNTGGNGGGNPSCAQVDVWTPPGLSAVNYNYTDPYVGGLPQPPAIPGTHGFGRPFGHPLNSGATSINKINPEQKYIVFSNMQVPTSDLDTQFTFAGSPGWGENGSTTVSISECPGNFNPSTARCVIQTQYNSSIKLSNRPAVANSSWANQPNFCYVEKGKTYYINFVFAQPYDGVIKNNKVVGEECLSAVGMECAIFWGENAWYPGF